MFRLLVLGTPPTTVTIAPGVEMPLLNMGVVRNHSVWLSLGGRGLDTALTYGQQDQQDVGRAVRESGLDRSEVFVTTKVPCCPSAIFCTKYDPGVLPQCRAEHNVTKDVEDTLSALGLAYADLLLLHWPCDSLDESVRAYKALEPLVAAGKARAIGVSNFCPSSLRCLLESATVTPAVNQVQFHVGMGADPGGIKSFCTDKGIALQAYSPLNVGTPGAAATLISGPLVSEIGVAHGLSLIHI